MSPRSLTVVALILSVGLSACSRSAEPTATTDTAASAPTDAVAAPTPATDPAAVAEASGPATTAPIDFDPATVPEATKALPPFPFFEAPSGLASTLDAHDREIPFDREHMISGGKVVALEGKVHRDRFQLANPEQREYSAIEFQRNYSDAILALGGVEASRVQYTNEVNDAFGGRDAVDKHYHGTCASDGCENHTYLLRQGGTHYWVQVSTGAIPLHGEIVVLEQKAMESKLGYLEAAAMKKALDAEGRVALYINFDTDRASLRPDALPAIAQITKLLQSDPALRVRVEGHTDDTGTAAHNRELSTQRAGTVVATLAAQGIDPSRLSATGYGSDNPLV
ncbi:MAG: OmpA family protein, partial [Arenimonas sp.]